MTWAAISLEALIGKVHVGTPICSHFWRSHPTTSPTRQRWYPFGREKQNLPRDEATYACPGCCGLLLDCRWALMLCSLAVFEASAVRIFNATYSPSISVCWTSEIVELVPYPSLLTTTYLSLWNFVSDVRMMITPGTVMVYILDFVWMIEPGPWWKTNTVCMYIHYRLVQSFDTTAFSTRLSKTEAPFLRWSSGHPCATPRHQAKTLHRLPSADRRSKPNFEPSPIWGNFFLKIIYYTSPPPSPAANLTPFVQRISCISWEQ